MIRIVNGDVCLADTTYIAHQVNCQGRMASGVAKDIAKNFPDAKREYMVVCENTPQKESLLGKTQIVGRVINMYTQLNYGYDGAKYTSTEAFESSLRTIASILNEGETVAFPYKIGCVRGGADWSEISALIERVMPTDTAVFYKI